MYKHYSAPQKKEISIYTLFSSCFPSNNREKGEGEREKGVDSNNEKIF